MKKNLEIVAFDFDGVCFPLVDEFTKWVIETGRLSREQVTPVIEWDFYKSWGISGETFKTWLSEFHWKGVPYPDVLPVINTLKGHGRKVIGVTTRPDAAYQATHSWVNEHGLKFDEIHIVNDKTTVKFDIIIDDHVTNLERVAEVGRFAVCLDRPWNRKWEGPRVGSLTEYLDTITAIESLLN